MGENKIKILIEISHPARVHLFKYFYWELVKRGHEVLVVVIDKEKSVELLEIYKIPFKIIGINKLGYFKKSIQLAKNNIQLFKIGLIFKPDIFISGASLSLAHVSFLLRKPYISFSDTEHAKLTWKLTKPFITKVITPSGFLKDFGKKHIRINGYKELAYLHPHYFLPNPQILKTLNISQNEKFVFLRFISWGAQHDIGHTGISDEIKIKAVNEFSKYAKVFISAEGNLPAVLEKHRINIPIEMIHHVLYYASLYFGESGTMATESAILGTPTVRVSTLAKLLGNFKELSEKYDLIKFYDNDVEGFEIALEILKDKNSKKGWQIKAQKLLNEKIDVTKYLVDFVINKENYE